MSECSRCASTLKEGVFFCTQCGAAQLNTMIGSKDGLAIVATTSSYDPGNPAYKPWRESSHVISKPILPANAVAVKHVSAWKAPMRSQVDANVKEKNRQINRLKKKDASKQQQQQQEGDELRGKEGGGEADGLPRVKTPGVVYYRQHAFQRRGAKNLSLLQQDSLLVQGGGGGGGAGDDDAASCRSLESSKQGEADAGVVPDEQLFVHPLAVYDATWFPEAGYTIHVSLVDRNRGEKYSRFFLRVGTVFENKWGTVSNLNVLDVLQNDVSRLLTPPQQYWIDLNLVNPHEYYMGTFLQESLRYVAARVHMASSTVTSMIDQICLVEAVYQGGLSTPPTKDALPVMAVVTEQKLDRRVRKRRGGDKSSSGTENVAVEPLKKEAGRVEKEEEKQERSAGSGETATSSSSPAPTPPAPTSPTPAASIEPEIYLDKTIASISCRIPIGKSYDKETVMTTARMSIRYPDAALLMKEELPKKHHEITAPVKATQVEISLFPTYCQRGVKASPKMISFDVQALTVLIGSTDVDEALTAGYKACSLLLRSLTQLLYFSKPESGGGRLKLGVTGACMVAAEDQDLVEEEEEEEEEAAPETMNEEEEIETEEQARERRHNLLMMKISSAKNIQKQWRGGVVRMRCVLDTKRFQLRLKNAAVRTIQSRVRIFIALRKVHGRRLARRRLELDAATAANASAFTEKLLSEEKETPPLCRCHQVENCSCLQKLTTIKGTKVALFGLFLFGEQFVEKGSRPLSPLSQLEAAVRNSTGVASRWNMTIHVMNREEEEVKKEEVEEEKTRAVDEEAVIEKRKRLFSAFCVIDSNQLLTCAMELVKEEEAMSGIHHEKYSKAEKRQQREERGGGGGGEEEEEEEEEENDGGGGKRQGGGFSFEDYYVEPQDDDDVYISPRTTLNDMIHDQKSKEKLFSRIVSGLDLFLSRSAGVCKLVFVPSKIKPVEVFVDEEDGALVCSF